MIKLGIDPIAGMNMTCILSGDLRDYLHDYGICMLNQAHNMGEGISAHSYRLTLNDLDLDGVWKVEWYRYISDLSHGDIRLIDK